VCGWIEVKATTHGLVYTALRERLVICKKHTTFIAVATVCVYCMQYACKRLLQVHACVCVQCIAKTVGEALQLLVQRPVSGMRVVFFNYDSKHVYLEDCYRYSQLLHCTAAASSIGHHSCDAHSSDCTSHTLRPTTTALHFQ
jgi:hypothetical protein